MLNKLADELKEIRLAKGLTVQQVAIKTKIDYKFLEAMESGDYEFLPELYVKAFYKEYIKMLGVDEALYLKKYEAAKQGRTIEESVNISETKNVTNVQSTQPVQPEHNEPKITSFDAVRKYKNLEEESSAARRRKKRLLYYIIAGSVVLLAIMYMFLMSESDDIIVPEKPWEEVIEEKPETTDSIVNPETSEESMFVTDSLRLTIKATDTSWIRIVVDDSKSEEFTMMPQSQKLIRGANNFVIVCGNGGAVKFDLNGKPLAFQGKRGAVQKIQIDTAGVKNLEVNLTGR